MNQARQALVPLMSELTDVETRRRSMFERGRSIVRILACARLRVHFHIPMNVLRRYRSRVRARLRECASE